MNNKKESGQIALIVILVMTIVGALAVSIASRSTTGSAIQQVDIKSGEALETAQSGLETVLSNPSAPLSGTLAVGGGQSTYDVTKTTLSTDYIVTPSEVKPGEVVEIDLSSPPTPITGIEIYWNPGISGNVPAIFGTKVETAGLEDFAFDDTGTNGFVLTGKGSYLLQGVNYAYKQTISVDAATKSVKIMPLKNGAFFFFKPLPLGASFSDHGFVIRSIGKVINGTQVIQRGVEYSQTEIGSLPPVFDYALFSLGPIVQ